MRIWLSGVCLLLVGGHSRAQEEVWSELMRNPLLSGAWAYQLHVDRYSSSSDIGALPGRDPVIDLALQLLGNLEQLQGVPSDEAVMLILESADAATRSGHWTKEHADFEVRSGLGGSAQARLAADSLLVEIEFYDPASCATFSEITGRLQIHQTRCPRVLGLDRLFPGLRVSGEGELPPYALHDGWSPMQLPDSDLQGLQRVTTETQVLLGYWNSHPDYPSLRGVMSIHSERGGNCTIYLDEPRVDGGELKLFQLDLRRGAGVTMQLLRLTELRPADEASMGLIPESARIAALRENGSTSHEADWYRVFGRDAELSEIRESLGFGSGTRVSMGVERASWRVTWVLSLGLITASVVVGARRRNRRRERCRRAV